MVILVKHTDKLVSLMNNRQVINQFNVYVINDDNKPIYAELAYGHDQLNLLINKLWKSYFSDKSENDKVDLIKHVSFFEFYNTFNENE